MKNNNENVQVSQKSILKISDLHKRYNEGKSNEVQALRGVDLTVGKGDMMAIMGSSGCGKTTLLNMIGNLDRRSSGNNYRRSRNLHAIRWTENGLSQRQNRFYISIIQSFSVFDCCGKCGDSIVIERS